MARDSKDGAPSVGLYLRVGPALEMEMLTRDLKQIFFTINGGEYERNMHALEISGTQDDDPEFVEKAQALCQYAAMSGIVPVYRGHPDMAREIGAEGVLLLDLSHMPRAKEHFGAKGVIGYHCGIENEEAAAAYDAGVDFVCFGLGSGKMPAADVLKFWTMLTELPAVVEGNISNDYAAYYVEAGAGFIDSTDYIWNHPKGVMQGTVNMMHAIDLALEAAVGKGKAVQ